MFENLSLFQTAGGMARHAVSRQEVIAKNIANADTPGYRAKDIVSFADAYQAEPQTGLRATRFGHVGNLEHKGAFQLSDPPGASSPNGNTVSLEIEMMKATEVRHQHDLALSVYKSSLNILRSSLGRK